MATGTRPTTGRGTRPARAIGVAATAVAVLAGVTLAARPAADAAEAIPSWKYPATVDTGYRIRRAGALEPSVSASGRWVVWAEQDNEPGVAPNPDVVNRYGGVYLRDRWNDVTIRLHGGYSRPVMSSGGTYVAWGVHPQSGRRYTEVYSTVTGETRRIPDPDEWPTARVLGVNDDGWVYARGRGNFFAKVTPDVATPAFVGGAHFKAPITAMTPSLRWAVQILPTGDVVRLDMQTGGQTDPEPMGTDRIVNAAISANGRYIVTLEDSTAPSKDGTATLRRWDATNHDVVRFDVPLRPYATRISALAVFDDGTFVGTGTSTLAFYDPASAGPKATALPATAKGLPIDYGVSDPFAVPAPGVQAHVATDIHRVLGCTQGAAIAPDDNNRDDCYLIPFGPSPLAGWQP